MVSSVRQRCLAPNLWPHGTAVSIIAMASEQEKIDYLSERIGYDVVMLNYTFMRLLTSRSTRSSSTSTSCWKSFGVTHGIWFSFFLRSRGKMITAHPTTSPISRHRIERVSTKCSLGWRGRCCMWGHCDLQIRARGSTSMTRVSFTPGSCRRSLSFRKSSPHNIARASVPSGKWRRCSGSNEESQVKACSQHKCNSR